jgi:hypothetical protein
MADSDDDRTIGELFAAEVVEYVRDPAVRSGLSLVDGSWPGKLGAEWAAADNPERLRMAVCNAVDAAIFKLLDAIDNAAIELLWVRTPGDEPVEIAGASNLELPGDYLVEYRSLYSKEPYYEEA